MLTGISLGNLYEDVLTFSVPLNLIFPYGKKRCTFWKVSYLKSLYLKLVRKILLERSCKTLVVDALAQFTTLSRGLPKYVEEIIIRFLESMPKSYSHVNLVADCYRDFNLKQVKEKKWLIRKDLHQIMCNLQQCCQGKWRNYTQMVLKSTYRSRFWFHERPFIKIALAFEI